MRPSENRSYRSAREKPARRLFAAIAISSASPPPALPSATALRGNAAPLPLAPGVRERFSSPPCVPLSSALGERPVHEWPKADGASVLCVSHSPLSFVFRRIRFLPL